MVSRLQCLAVPGGREIRPSGRHPAAPGPQLGAERLIALCWLHDAAGVTDLLAANPGLAVPADDQAEIAKAATRNDTEAVRLMLQAGLPVTAAASTGPRRSTGRLPRQPRHDTGDSAVRSSAGGRENDYKSKPLGWATYGSEHGWYSGSGDYTGAVEALLAAGAKVPRRRAGPRR